jgi:GNAT superfamily N-acetyltransferase
MEIRRVIHGSHDYGLGVELRRQLLRLPLGLDFTAEELDVEGCDVFLVGFRGDQAVATLVLSSLEHGEVKMRQVAVAEGFQSLGLGTAMVHDAERIATETGFSKMIVSARLPAVAFYEKLGYAHEGETYEEIGIPHQKLTKSLAPN